MYIAENPIVTWLSMDRDDQWHKLSEQKWHVPHNIQINKGDEIKIDALSENGSFVSLDNVIFTESTCLNSPLTSSSKAQKHDQTFRPSMTSEKDLITIYPEEYNHAIKNPFKGFRTNTQDHEYGTLIKYYFKWNELENLASDDVNKIMSTCNIRWLGIEKNNIKAIPRVYLEWPGQRRRSEWPADMVTGDYTSIQFKERVIALIKKLGQAWDNDSRVAYVEMGLIGQWGEMEFSDTNDEIKEAIAAQFSASFQNKLVMIRWPNTYHIYNFGYYWDSFAHHDQEYYAFHVNNTSPKWETAFIGGEVAYDWGNLNIQPGESPDISLKNTVHRDYIIDMIRKLHANHLGWISKYNHNDLDVRTGAELMQKALGYRLVITEVSYPKKIHTDTAFSFSFKVKNTGSSPFYYKWPIEVSLLDPNTKQVLWKKQLKDTDIRTWLPGDDWDDTTNVYKIPAVTYTISQTLMLSDLVSGEYIFALAILDPAGNSPSSRFAIKNYYNGGRHPIGMVGINKCIEKFELDAGAFVDLKSDKSLLYTINSNLQLLKI